jgi:magnesium-transporting ATPase (P-type)
VRDGRARELAVEDVVEGDLVRVQSGDRRSPSSQC